MLYQIVSLTLADGTEEEEERRIDRGLGPNGGERDVYFPFGSTNKGSPLLVV